MEKKLSVSRSELKYLVNNMKRAEINMELQRFMLPDSYSTEGSYRVKSLYFDTINNMDFYDKRNGENIKKKIRLRTYDEKSDFLKLECKEKVGNLQRKTSLLVNRQEAQLLMDANYEFLLFRKEKDASKIYSILMLGAYRPVVIVEYDRRAYTYPEYSTRVTFDSNVRYSEVNLNIFDENINYNYVLLENTILEVKYNKFLVNHIKKILARHSLNNVSYSKYEWCRSLLN